MPDETAFWVALASDTRIGARSFQKLLARFSTIRAAWTVSERELRAAGLTDPAIAAILSLRTAVNPDEVLRRLRHRDIGVVTCKDSSYPRLLTELPDPPAVLFVRGILPKEMVAVSVVGSRRATSYGRRVTELLVDSLVDRGVVIVSGLALGIDAVAHEATLQAGGTTIAVLGSGLDRITPSSHTALSRAIIAQRGAVISEFPLGTPSFPSNFPVRNRIIAGLSLGTVVIEAAHDSGSLLTAKAALEYNREVFAVPGDIFRETSEGTNTLIAQGAKVVRRVDDILDELSLPARQQAQRARRLLPASPVEESILALLSGEPRHIDTLVKVSNMEIAQLHALLMVMEMKGIVKNVGANQYVRGES
jgi:DNA processing protein